MIIYGLGATISSSLLPFVIQRNSIMVKKENFHKRKISLFFFYLDFCIIYNDSSFINNGIITFKSISRSN
jgi:hypothetical protein